MKKINVAIADDHTILRKALVSLLNGDERFQVVTDAPNGRELLRMLSVSGTMADVCLLDVNMPQMNGYETLVALREQYPDMRILILSQFDHENIIIRMLKTGASGYLFKDVDPNELKQAIHTIVVQPYYSNRYVNGRLFYLVQHNTDYDKRSITEREQTFLKLCCSELTYKEIAGRMSTAESTIAFYRGSLFQKLKVRSRTGLVLYALRIGLVPLSEID